MPAEGSAARSEQEVSRRQTDLYLLGARRQPAPVELGLKHGELPNRPDRQLAAPRRCRPDGLEFHFDELRQMPAAADVVTTRPSDEQTFEPGQFPGAVLADIDAVPIGLGDRVGCL